MLVRSHSAPTIVRSAIPLPDKLQGNRPKLRDILPPPKLAIKKKEFTRKTIRQNFSQVREDYFSKLHRIRRAPRRVEFSLSKLKKEIQTVRRALPCGATMDGTGNLTGRHTFDYVPKFREEQMANWKRFTDKSIEFAFNIAKQDAVAKAKGKVKCFDGSDLKLGNTAQGDFPRLNFEIPVFGDIFQSSQIREKSEVERHEIIANTLQAFTGDKNATLVLSTILSQDTLIPLLNCIADADGNYISHFKMLSAMNQGKFGEKPYIQRHDELEQIKALGLGGCKWRLAHDANDFKISIDWPIYMFAEEGHEHLLPLNEGSVVGIRLQADIIVDGSKARRGEVHLEIPGGLRAEYSGRLALSKLSA
jgi:hypothetical protein